MVKNGGNSKCKLTRNGGFQINATNEQGYRKLQDHLQKSKIFYHTNSMEKSDFRVVVRGLPMSSDLKDICEDLEA